MHFVPLVFDETERNITFFKLADIRRQTRLNSGLYLSIYDNIRSKKMESLTKERLLQSQDISTVDAHGEREFVFSIVVKS